MKLRPRREQHKAERGSPGPGGYLFVSGVGLDVRTKVALDLGWEPVMELIAEIHDGDPSVRALDLAVVGARALKEARLANQLCRIVSPQRHGIAR